MPTGSSKSTLKQLRENFADVHPRLTADEAVTEASRCLFCYDAPCARACPTHIDIPNFIRKIMHRDNVGSAKTILDANIFGGSCARVCPTEVLCEGACVDNTMLKAPVQIGRLQWFACDTAHEASFGFYEAGADTGKHVAIVGGGPAGLSCAHGLRRLGHRVTVYEARKVAGGLNTLGIAAYKITTDFALTEVDRVLHLGVDLKLKSPVDGAGVAELLESHDAVCLAVGLGNTAALGIPGEDHKDCMESLEFVFQTHEKALNKCRVGKHVVVIGGGNTAIDAANAAVRLGAETVTVAYRRDRASMPAFEHEVAFALASGVEFVFNAKPKRVMAKAGKVTGVRFARTRLQGKGRKAKLATVPNGDFTVAADFVVKALGQEPLDDLVTSVPKLKLNKKCRIVVDEATGATSVRKLFAAGDCQADTMEEVVNAVQRGKIAAAGIDAMLAGTTSPAIAR